MATASRVLAGEALLCSKGVETHGTPVTAEAVLLLIRSGSVCFTGCCVMFIVADSNHLHAHQFLT